MEVSTRPGRAGIIAGLWSMLAGALGAAGADPLTYWLGVAAVASGILASWVTIWLNVRRARREERGQAAKT